MPSTTRRTTAGRPRLGAGRRRQFRGLYLDPVEEMRIEASAAAAGMPTGRYIRRAALGRQIAARPSVANLLAWQDLARVAANLNQLVHLAHLGRLSGGDELVQLLVRLGVDVAALRAELLGVGSDDPSEARPGVSWES